jgi:hypothetical protein
MFALISYYDAMYARSQGIIANTAGAANSLQVNPGADGYDFTVLTLQVVFKNSAIDDFESRIRLSATNWFNEPAVADCTIDLTGNYESHNGIATYSFSTLKDQSYQFYINSKVMNYVQVVKATFNTNHKPADSVNAGVTAEDISSTFSFWGYLNFEELPGFDMFSFGDSKPEPGSSSTGLSFYNLAIKMDFELASRSTALKTAILISRQKILRLTFRNVPPIIKAYTVIFR